MIGIVPSGRFLDSVNLKTDPRWPRRERMWTLSSRLRYVDSLGMEIWVPTEFQTDGLSIPRFFWRIVGHPLSLDSVAAGVIHDFLWMQAVAGKESFVRANWVFLDALKTLGVGPVKRRLMWAAVSLNAARIVAWRFIRRVWR